MPLVFALFINWAVPEALLITLNTHHCRWKRNSIFRAQDPFTDKDLSPKNNFAFSAMTETRQYDPQTTSYPFIVNGIISRECNIFYPKHDNKTVSLEHIERVCVSAYNLGYLSLHYLMFL